MNAHLDRFKFATYNSCDISQKATHNSPNRPSPLVRASKIAMPFQKDYSRDYSVDRLNFKNKVNLRTRSLVRPPDDNIVAK